jgi:hypothetical protein
LDRDAVADLIWQVPGFAQCRLHGRSGRHAKLGVQCLGKSRSLLGGGVTACHPVQTDKERLVVLIKRAHRGSTSGVADGGGERAQRH